MRVFAVVMVLLLILPVVVMAAVSIPTPMVGTTATYDEAALDDCVDVTLETVETTYETTTTYEIEIGEVVSEINEVDVDYNLYDILARAIYCEAGSCSEYCQWLVGSAILNLADERGGIENVVFDYNTINVAYTLYDCTPSNLSYGIASRLLSGDRDYYVKYFRTEYYHSFGFPYVNVDNVYFSTSREVR